MFFDSRRRSKLVHESSTEKRGQALRCETSLEISYEAKLIPIQQVKICF